MKNESCINGTAAIRPRMTKSTPLNTLYYGLSNFGQRDTTNTAVDATDMHVM